MTNMVYAYFAVFGDFDPSDVSRSVGIEPTKSWKKGELGPGGRSRDTSCWTLQSTLGFDDCLEAHVANVLDQLDANAVAFQKVSREFGGCMQLVAEFNAHYPGLHFERAMVERLALYALSIDFDFYGCEESGNTRGHRHPT